LTDPTGRRIRPELLEDEDLPVEFGRYTLLNILGEGGMARVFRAELRGPSGFRKRAAVKIIHATVAKRSEKLRRSLINEARLGGLLNHPNIVDTYEFGEEQGLPYIAMELVRGVGLDVMLELVRPIPAAQAIEIAIQICAGLDHAHSLEDDDGTPIHIVHRDLKPSNVLLSRDGLVKVMDFGIAKAATNAYNTTQTGMTKGTPAYMSPEQAEGLPLDGRSDLFAFGALLYEMVTGERLFRGENMVQVLMAVLRVDQLLAEEARWEWLDATVPGLRAVVTRCLHKDRELRFADCPELEIELKKLARELPPPVPLKTVVRELMKTHSLGGSQGSSSVRIPGASPPSSGGTPFPAADHGAHASAGTDVGPTRAQPVAGITPPSDPPPPVVMSPESSSRLSAVSQGGDEGTLWDGAPAQVSAQKPRSKALWVVLLLLLLGVAGGSYHLGSRGGGGVDPLSPPPRTAHEPEAEPPDVDAQSAQASKPTPASGSNPTPASASKPTPPAQRPTPTVDAKPPPERVTKPKATPRRLKPKAKAVAAKPKARRAVGPAFDPDDPNLVIEHARVSWSDNGNGTWSVRFTARIRGGAGATVKLHFNPRGASWIEKTMSSQDQVTFVESVVFRSRNLGKTYWYIEAVRSNGVRANWGTRKKKKRFEIKK
jgi:serine/threonine protein kinase